MNNKLIWENVLLSVALVAGFAVSGFVLSYLVGFALHPEVLAFKLGQQQMLSGDASNHYEVTRRITVLFMAALGAVAAQTTFLVRHFGERKHVA